MKQFAKSPTVFSGEIAGAPRRNPARQTERRTADACAGAFSPGRRRGMHHAVIDLTVAKLNRMFCSAPHRINSLLTF